MRKITLVAVAALATSTVFAAMPISPDSKTQTVKSHRVATAIVNPSLNGGIQSRAGEPVEMTGDEAAVYTQFNYVSVGSFYVGLTPTRRSFRSKFGLTPNYGRLGFLNFTSSTTNAWSWNTLDYSTDPATEYNFTADTHNLLVDLIPLTQVCGPTLKAAAEYNDSIRYCVGRNPFFWGLYAGNEEDEEPIETDKAGVTPSNATQSNFFGALATTVDRSGNPAYQSYYQSNGTANSWIQMFSETPKSVELKGFGEILPAMSYPYQLSSMYIWIDAVTTAATPLNVKVYALTSDGRIDTQTLLGDGVAILPEGTFSDVLHINLNQVDELGLPTTAPVCVTDGAYVEVSGFDAETVTIFGVIMPGSTVLPYANIWDSIWDTVYPQYTLVSLAVTTQEDEIRTGIYNMPFVFGAEEAGDDYMTRVNNYAFYYNVNFPVVLNAETGEADFSVVVPTAGGSETVFVGSNEDIEQLLADNYMKHEATADWFTFVVGYDEANKVTTVTVTADALPAGESGRYGEIKFTGYACDFTVTVTQGEAGINAVVANGQGTSEFYDLQGRKLNAAPAKGLYIERNGSAASTKVAR